jgi:hypothetical protein
VVGRGGIGPHTLPTVNKVGWSSCAGSCFAASGMTFFIGFVARYDIGGLLRGHFYERRKANKNIIYLGQTTHRGFPPVPIQYYNTCGLPQVRACIVCFTAKENRSSGYYSPKTTTVSKKQSLFLKHTMI